MVQYPHNWGTANKRTTMADFRRQFFLGPVLWLTIISSGSVLFRSSPNENPPQLKGSVSEVHRLQSWIRDRAIDKLPWSASNNTEDYYEDVHQTVAAMKTWAASQSSDHDSDANVLVDVISIGSESRMDYLHKQRDTWASPPFVRNMLMATEMNTDRSIMSGDASCQALELSCAKQSDVDSDVELESRRLQSNNAANETSAEAETEETNINATAVSTEELQSDNAANDTSEETEIEESLINATASSTEIEDLQSTNTADKTSAESDTDESQITAELQSKNLANEASAVPETEDSHINATATSTVEVQSNSTANMTPAVPETEESLIDATSTSTEEVCVQRRLGLAMGVSVRRYRKISHAFQLQSEKLGNDFSILPSFLVVVFDQMAYNIADLKTCDEQESAQIYAPSTSLKQMEGNNQDTSFPYPTNRSGLIFNRAAIERWILQVSCSSNDIQSYDSESFGSKFCSWMSDANQSPNAFDSALLRALELSKEDPITGVVEQNQVMSISDLFYKYSYSMHLLCSSHGVVPSGEEMIGYLIHRFNISDSPIGENQCMSKLQGASS